MMIIPKTKEELYIESLPFAERSAFSRARLHKDSLKSSGQKLPQTGTNSLKNRKPLSTTYVNGKKDITRSSIATDTKPRFMSKRQRSCKNCGYEHSATSENITGSAKEIIVHDTKPRNEGRENSTEKGSIHNKQDYNTLP